jgi:O-antigen ligase
MIIDIGIIALCCFAALAFGSNEPWAMCIIVAATGVLLAIRIIYDVWSGKLRLYAGWIYLPLILFLGLCGAQAWFWKRPMNATSLWSIHSVDRYSTILYLLLAASYIAIMFIVQNSFLSRGQIKLLLISVLILGTFESLYGLVQYLGDYDFIWNFERIADQGLASGTLINRNHYALLMNLIICTSVGFLFYRSKRILRTPKLSLRNAIGNPVSAKLLWIILIVALMGFALVFSMSRMGIIAMLCSIGVMIAATRAAESGRRGAVIGTLLLAAVLGLAVYTGIDPVLARYESVGLERRSEQDRVALWRDAWPMMKKNPIFGQGLGGFQWTYPAYEKVEPDIPAKYAHSDYVQAVAEVGVVGLLLLLWAGWSLWQTALKNLRSEDPLVGGIGLATIGALAAIFLQEITDFGLYIPGVAVMAAIIAGLNLRASRWRMPREKRVDEGELIPLQQD